MSFTATRGCPAGLAKRQKSGNPISNRCSPACVSGEGLAAALTNKADTRQMAANQTHLTPQEGEPCQRAEPIKSAGSRGQRGRGSEIRTRFLGGFWPDACTGQEPEHLSLNLPVALHRGQGSASVRAPDSMGKAGIAHARVVGMR